MKLKKEWRPAYREFYLVCRDYQYYDGCIYHSEKSAQKQADKMNARRNTEKAGKITVAHKDREGSYVLRGTLSL